MLEFTLSNAILIKVLVLFEILTITLLKMLVRWGLKIRFQTVVSRVPMTYNATGACFVLIRLSAILLSLGLAYLISDFHFVGPTDGIVFGKPKLLLLFFLAVITLPLTIYISALVLAIRWPELSKSAMDLKIVPVGRAGSTIQPKLDFNDPETINIAKLFINILGCLSIFLVAYATYSRVAIGPTGITEYGIFSKKVRDRSEVDKVKAISWEGSNKNGRFTNYGLVVVFLDGTEQKLVGDYGEQAYINGSIVNKNKGVADLSRAQVEHLALEASKLLSVSVEPL